MKHNKILWIMVLALLVSTTLSAKPKEVKSEEIKLFTSMFGEKLYDLTGNDFPVSTLAGKKIGIYFSAHWCPPCRRFSPILVKTYNKLQHDNKAFEIVFVSSDRSSEGMFKYMRELKMPWLAMKHGSKKAAALKKKYGIRGIPTLVIINPDGSLVTKDGRSQVGEKGVEAFAGW